MASPEEIFRDAVSLSADDRVEAERLIASLVEDLSNEIAQAQLSEVRRRIAEVESGKAGCSLETRLWRKSETSSLDIYAKAKHVVDCSPSELS